MKEISAGVEKEGKHNSGKNTKQAYSETEMTVSCFAARSSRLQQIHRSRFIFLHFDSVMFGPTGILTCWVKKLFHHYVEYVFTLKCSLARMNQGHILNQAWSKNIYIYIYKAKSSRYRTSSQIQIYRDAFYNSVISLTRWLHPPVLNKNTNIMIYFFWDLKSGCTDSSSKLSSAFYPLSLPSSSSSNRSLIQSTFEAVERRNKEGNQTWTKTYTTDCEATPSTTNISQSFTSHPFSFH